MTVRRITFLVVLSANWFALAALAEEPARLGAGVTPPKLLSKVEPEYTAEARSAYVQGTAVFDVVVGAKGRITDVEVISPIGFGLDQRAEGAMRLWEFKPGEKDGRPVSIRATVEVTFRLPEIWYDAKAERRRTSFNVALRRLEGENRKSAEQARQTILKLAHEQFAPAMYVVSNWLRSGEGVAHDPKRANELLLASAEKHYAPAMYQVAGMRLDGRDLPADANKGLELMRDAAVLGSSEAQLYLAAVYEAGDKVPADIERARRYYRLCAASGKPVCQLRLARLLMNAPGRPERMYVQAVAWLQMAAEAGDQQAQALVAAELPKLTPEQATWAAGLRRQLVASKHR